MQTKTKSLRIEDCSLFQLKIDFGKGKGKIGIDRWSLKPMIVILLTHELTCLKGLCFFKAGDGGEGSSGKKNEPDGVPLSGLSPTKNDRS